MHIQVVGAIFYNIIVHIFLFLKTVVYITSILNRLITVQVQGYVHAHTIKILIRNTYIKLKQLRQDLPSQRQIRKLSK